MTTQQEFVLPCWKKKQLTLKIIIPIIIQSTCTEECVSWRNINPASVLNFLKYSNNINLFSEACIPLTLVDQKLKFII